MSVNYISSYKKLNVTFATPQDAFMDKNSLFGPELEEAVQTSNNNMLAAGILLQQPYPVWDQVNHVLSIVKPCTSGEAYEAAVTFNRQAAVDAAAAAGWTFLGNHVE